MKFQCCFAGKFSMPVDFAAEVIYPWCPKFAKASPRFFFLIKKINGTACSVGVCVSGSLRYDLFLEKENYM